MNNRKITGVSARNRLLGVLNVVALTALATAQSDWNGKWDVLSPVQAGTNVSDSWNPLHQVTNTAWQAPNYGNVTAQLYNAPIPSMVEAKTSGTITLRIKWHNSGTPAPTYVYAKISVFGYASGNWWQYVDEQPGLINVFDPGIGPMQVNFTNHWLPSATKTVRLAVAPDGTASYSVNALMDVGYTSSFYMSTGCTFHAAVWATIGPPEPSPTFKVTKVDFTSAVTRVSNWNQDFEHEGTLEPVRGWQLDSSGNPTCFPILQPYSQAMSAVVTNELSFAAMPYNLQGSFFEHQVSPTPGVSTLGPVQTPVIANYTGSGSLGICSFNFNADWLAIFSDPGYASIPQSTGISKVFFTLASPQGYTDANQNLVTDVATLKRLNWAVNAVAAAGNTEDPPRKITSIDETAHAIWTTLSGDPPLNPPPATPPSLGNKTPWALLDGICTGDCLQQAWLMRQVLWLLGAPAQALPVYASYDATVTAMETAVDNQGRPKFLIMNFGDLDAPDWNQYEGVCQAGSSVYAVWPSLKSDSLLHMLNQQLQNPNGQYNSVSQVTQYWVYFKGVKTMADLKKLRFPLRSFSVDEGAGTKGVVDTTPVPFPGG